MTTILLLCYSDKKTDTVREKTFFLGFGCHGSLPCKGTIYLDPRMNNVSQANYIGKFKQ